MVNRKQQILQLQAVSKSKKQKLICNRKTQCIKIHSNIKFIDNLQQQYPEPSPPIQHSEIQIDFINKSTKNRTATLAYENRDFQDSNLTKHISQQLIIVKVVMMIMALLCISLTRISQTANTVDIFQVSGKTVVLSSHSIITLTMIILAILKHVKIRQLTIKQLIKFSPYQLNLLGINPQFILQLLFLTIHPNRLTLNISMSIKQPVYQQYSSVPLNNLLQIVMLARIYLLFSAIASTSIYLSTRSSRICRIYGTKCNLYFGLKCLFNTRPLFFLIVIFLSMIFVFGQMVRVSERNIQSSSLGIFGNSLWCVMITMSTVGYGDYYPMTYLSRIILFLASITGIIIASLLILTLSTYLSMQMSQNKAHITMHRLVLRRKLQQLAKGVMFKSAVLSKMQNKQKDSDKQIKALKKQTDDVKYTLRKIKNIIDTDNINEEMDRLFETLEDNIKQAYLNQIKYAEALQQMHEVETDKIAQMKFSFTQQIQNIIKDR